MSAFQEFGHLSERRKAERHQKMRKRVALISVSTLVLIILIAAGVFALVYQSKHDAKTNVIDDPTSSTKQISSSMKAIKMMCAPTDYKKVCESTLSNAVGSNSTAQPKDLMKTAVLVIIDEVHKAFNRSSAFETKDPKIKGALDDCKELFGYAIDDLRATVKNLDIHEIGDLPEKAHDLKTWLSAAISYQQTCVDGFPEGKLKAKMEDTIVAAKQLTSNALAIVNEAASLLSMLKIPGFNQRRLLESNSPTVGKDGLPDWMSAEERRVLAEHSKKGALKPNVVVAKDGSGDYTSISDALGMMPENYKGRYVIYVKAGIYNEAVIVEKKMTNVTMYGDGARKTIVTNNNNFVDGTSTFQTATFAAIGDGFIAKDMAFRNTAGTIKHQAVALRVQSDRSIFLNCRIEGYQDTLYVQTHRQFYRSCVIAGTIDFIFGDAAAVFQSCTMVVRKPLDNQQNIVTAQGRIDRHETTGIVLHNCIIRADKKLVPLKNKIKSYLGRPWKEYSRTIIMESTIEDLIHPDGWFPWDGNFALKTLVYAEYNNKGPGATLKRRVKWPGYKVINKKEAMKYTVANFIQGAEWLKGTGTPVDFGLLK
ncbi:putative pectinesterase/pectinesterase inhibitor 45 [Tasmannia lanceolata]|uniref:putative pectinesterase/pectinesterase inhibitor 45 n=1 Tax=Tasmannia lanceolata TaxID=3420 RepID=UPI004062F9C5